MSKVHAKLSPSAAERWFNCSGVINLINRLVDEGKIVLDGKPSKYAAEGTVAHQLAEDFVQGKTDLLTLTSRVGEVVMQEGFEVEITDAMIEGVIEYVDHIGAVRRMMKNKPAGIHGEAEVQVTVADLKDEAGNDIVFGTSDYILYQKGDELHVFDFKFGKGVVPATENKQGLTYVVGAMDTLGTKAFGKVYIHIVQPRRMDGGEAVDTWELPPGRVEKFREELRAAVERTKDPKAPLAAGSWCKFCPAEAYCPEKKGAIEATVQASFTKIPGPPSKEVGVAMTLPPVALMTAEQVARALDWEDSIDSWFEALRERAQSQLAKDPDAIPGYKLVEGRSNRAWADEAVVETSLAMLGEERYQPRKLKSPAQMEKIAGKDAVAKLTFKPAGKLTVARADDKRQAVTHVSSKDAASVFGGAPAIKTPIDAQVLPEDNIFGDLLGGAPTPEPAKKMIWPT